MTNRTAASRYARALLDVAIKEHVDLARIETELTGVGDLVRDHRPLALILLNPAVPAPRKQGLMIELAARGNLLPVVSKLLALLAERDRLVILPDLIAAYREKLLDYQKVVRAEVTTSVPLAADRATQIQHDLQQATGRTVTLATRVDPGIIGGIVARIGSTVYDASIANQLVRVRQKLEEGTRG